MFLLHILFVNEIREMVHNILHLHLNNHQNLLILYLDYMFLLDILLGLLKQLLQHNVLHLHHHRMFDQYLLGKYLIHTLTDWIVLLVHEILY